MFTKEKKLKNFQWKDLIHWLDDSGYWNPSIKSSSIPALDGHTYVVNVALAGRVKLVRQYGSFDVCVYDLYKLMDAMWSS